MEDTDTRQLLENLSIISKKGPIISSFSGSNAVGKTLQKELGIEHSTTHRNRIYNYTVTATTNNSGGGRTNLFACVPDWGSSEIKSSHEHVITHGKPSLEKGYSKALFCTLSTLGPNSFGLYLKSDPKNLKLEEWIDQGGDQSRILNWNVDKIFGKVKALSRTAIISALKLKLNGKIAFHYRYAELLGKPDPQVFLQSVDDGIITLDHCISIKRGSDAAREQGPLFKIHSLSKEVFYGDVKRIDLFEL